jgi:hypothetical protein
MMSMRDAIILLALVSAGCAHTVKYKLTESERWPEAKPDKTLAVTTFADNTVPQEAKTIQVGDYTWRTNYRSRYKNKEIADGVSAMIAKHLKHSGLFKDVRYGQGTGSADLELSGTIAEYWAKGRVNKGAEGGVLVAAAGFGLVGALVGMAATSGQTTEIQAAVALEDVTLKDLSTGQVLFRDSIRSETNFVAHFTEADEPAVFRHADECLKQAVKQLIARLTSRLRPPAPPPQEAAVEKAPAQSPGETAGGATDSD